MQYQNLSWDTEFFGFGVARISESSLSDSELSALLMELKINGVRLVYWPSTRMIDELIVSQYSGFLADIKHTFVVDFGALNYEKFTSTKNVEPYRETMSIRDLENLATQSSEYSRFSVDKKISRMKLAELYNIWIKRSLKKEIAEEVLVIRDCDRTTGMITLGNKNGRGDIGLIAVHNNYRGKQYGEKLVRASQLWFRSNGYQVGQVVTQGANIPACNLYRKCDYTVETVEYFYHFWL